MGKRKQACALDSRQDESKRHSSAEHSSSDSEAECQTHNKKKDKRNKHKKHKKIKEKKSKKEKKQKSKRDSREYKKSLETEVLPQPVNALRSSRSLLLPDLGQALTPVGTREMSPRVTPRVAAGPCTQAEANSAAKTITKFWDPELGRMRSRSGTGEIVEECVSRRQQQQIMHSTALHVAVRQYTGKEKFPSQHPWFGYK
mmetsp:Transcript_44218/g.84552  ORF Transcript_44218/g.84552 Transcript_44218/m.84552 type:complete len:200 (-) Transcript_44218:358-957(-)|eukprot:CAMPEP_0114281870 /NCGR_PEP_ID=MMETSP0059-20121206/3245_1 /TAXON_ID=36894 /ORGANISM="Pyramimonas parkeae, Strain CCMP726" /LENGTH=199 /DNA_ID=CAMNT_0001402453 /DNA_START=219 /DNA_END=818 /DNA_ORIENTATION=+